MKVTIQPSQLKGIVQAPASKSSMQRACAAAILKEGDTWIKNAGHSNDDKVALQIVSDLGAFAVDHLSNGDEVIIGDGVKCKKTVINCGESGLSIRMFTPIISLCENEVTIYGSGSLVNRPLDFFDKILPQLDVKIKTNDGKVPIIVKGPLKPKNIEIDGSLSSQFLTGLLMAYSAADAKDVSIKVKDLKSRPYIDLTLSVMEAFGMKMPENKNYEEFYFEDKTHIYPFTYQEYTVEGDWSGGAFLLVAGAIAGPITIKGLDLTSTQGDKAIVDALMLANAGIAMEAKGIKIHPSEMNAFNFDATDCPDLFPPLVALAAYCKGKTKIKGVSRLIHKESNRALTLQEEFGKIGVKIELKSDEMIIHGGSEIKGTKVHSHHDHRIAMALAVAALKANGETIIEEAQAVKKSYPDFYNDLKTLGASVSLPYKLF
jgi:3-phosphoshikimate 1-carboxyvinyltransferase